MKRLMVAALAGAAFLFAVDARADEASETTLKAYLVSVRQQRDQAQQERSDLQVENTLFRQQFKDLTAYWAGWCGKNPGCATPGTPPEAAPAK